MSTFTQTRKHLTSCANRNLDGYSKNKQQQRERYIKASLNTGGKSFVKRVKKYGCTEKGAPLRLREDYLEYLELLGDFRVPWVLTTGSAQVGKTLGHTMLMIDGVASGKLNGAWFYDSHRALDQMVPIQFQPLARGWLNKMEQAGRRFRRGSDRSINTRFQVDGVNAIFTFVSTSRKSREDTGKAAVASAAASFQADYAIMEERSQYEPGSADVCMDRLNNSMIPTKPRRDLGTPGGGLGIEADMKDCQHYFYPHYTCPNCGETHPLDPKGCILKKVERTNTLGKVILSHLSEAGRPMEWWHDDPENPVSSAYVGCSKCGHKLSVEVRINARYRCIYTGVWLRNYLDDLPSGVPEKLFKIGLHMSPLASENKSVAQEIVYKGLTTDNTSNWQQQALGHYSESETLHLTQPMIVDRIGAPLPKDLPDRDYRIAGIDMGRGEDWVVIIDYYLPPDRDKLSPPQIAEQTIRNLIFGKDILRDTIPTILTDYYVEAGFIDNEPSRDSSMEICRESCLEMANQTAKLKDTMRKTIVEDGGIQYPCWNLLNEKFMLAVFQAFTLPAWDGEACMRLPESWEKWIGNPTERSPLRHLSGPWRDANNQWHRGKDNLDDFYMAILFAEAAFYLRLTEDYGFGDDGFAIGSYGTR